MHARPHSPGSFMDRYKHDAPASDTKQLLLLAGEFGTFEDCLTLARSASEGSSWAPSLARRASVRLGRERYNFRELKFGIESSFVRRVVVLIPTGLCLQAQGRRGARCLRQKSRWKILRPETAEKCGHSSLKRKRSSVREKLRSRVRLQF